MADTRPMRQCDICRQVDDHPRHRVVFGPQDNPPPVDTALIEEIIANNDYPPADRAAMVASISDPTDQLRHLDCCAAAGCPDGSCNAIRATGAENLKGPRLLKHLQSGAVDHLTSGAQASDTKEG
jgi:hypothetical protein